MHNKAKKFVLIEQKAYNNQDKIRNQSNSIQSRPTKTQYKKQHVEAKDNRNCGTWCTWGVELKSIKIGIVLWELGFQRKPIGRDVSMSLIDREREREVDRICESIDGPMGYGCFHAKKHIR